LVVPISISTKAFLSASGICARSRGGPTSVDLMMETSTEPDTCHMEKKAKRFAWLPGIERLKRDSKAFDPRQLASGSLASDTEMARTALTLASAASSLHWNTAHGMLHIRVVFASLRSLWPQVIHINDSVAYTKAARRPEVDSS
jgi:hypothetical protein